MGFSHFQSPVTPDHLSLSLPRASPPSPFPRQSPYSRYPAKPMSHGGRSALLSLLHIPGLFGSEPQFPYSGDGPPLRPESGRMGHQLTQFAGGGEGSQHLKLSVLTTPGQSQANRERWSPALAAVSGSPGGVSWHHGPGVEVTHLVWPTRGPGHPVPTTLAVSCMCSPKAA